MDKKTKGAWIFHHSGKLESVVTRTDFESISIAGKAGVLLSALSTQDQVSVPTSRVEALAKTNNISKLELPGVLEKLRERNLVEFGQAGVDVLGVGSTEVLSHTAALFESLSPSPEEEAVIVLAEETSHVPLDNASAAEFISDTHEITDADVAELLERAEEIGFVDGEEIDSQTRLLFNGNLFRRDNAKKIQKVFGSLNAQEQRLSAEASELLKRRGCVPREELERLLSGPLFEKLVAVGVFDINAVANQDERIEYATLPAAFGKFGDPFVDDALDLAKAFVTCLTYGMTRRDPSRGRITMLRKLLGKLIRGGEVGPATAIGEDYQALEMRGVIRVRRVAADYYMRLLKPEVGELALKVLTEGDASEESLLHFPGASVSQYQKPEENRAQRRTRMRKTKGSSKGARDVLVALRSSR